MPLNVAFYSDSLTTKRQYGLSRYAWELLRELNKLEPRLTVRPVSAHRGADAKKIAGMRGSLGYVPLPWGRKVTAGLWSTVRAPLLERWTPWADVVHSVEPGYPIATRKPLVVTIHDIGPITHPAFFCNARPWLLKKALLAAADRAAAIVCVSQATADATRNFLRRDLGDRLHVIYEGVSEEFFQAGSHEKEAATLAGGEPYFLWSGSFSPRKNVVRVVEAFERIAARHPHHLVLCGGAGWDATVTLERVQASRFAARIHLPGRVDDAGLRAYYRGATAYVFASLMEGFGLPVLEAMASGCPVITSNISSMPEVAGDAARLVDPTNLEEIAQAMNELAVNEPLCREMALNGRKRAGQFRWSSCAHAIANCYRRASGV
jgi:glycosyltransferase involved in cell wall biosynthesis